MPYIAQKNRPVYISSIEKVVDLINEEKDVMFRAEYVEYFLGVMANCFLYGSVYSSNPDTASWYDSSFLDIHKKGRLFDAANCIISNVLHGKDLLSQAGDLNYNMSAVIWGVSGDALGSEVAKYGFRAYVKSALMGLIKDCENLNSRRSKMLKGVLDDVKLETYRRRTALYEDQKIKEHGDVWPLRTVTWQEIKPEAGQLDLNVL